jgi:uncharacterized UBP type Zn finger protein
MVSSHTLTNPLITAGQANYGHYWIYIRDHVDNKWWKYNDTNVTEVSSEEIFKDTTGSTANPYFLVYVRSSGKLAFPL